MSLVLKGARLIDPETGRDGPFDLLLDGDRIARVEAPGILGAEGIDLAGMWIVPGLVDMHVHLRDPGQTHKEDLASGIAGSVAGGFTDVACMPNTAPALDSAGRIADVVSRARQAGPVRVHPIGAMTVGRGGKEPAAFAEMLAAGAVAFSDDGDPVADPAVAEEVYSRLARLDALAFPHPEDRTFGGPGVVNQNVARRLGVPGIPPAAEEEGIRRDIELAERTGVRLHLAHVSTARGAEMIRRAKVRGVRLSAEVTPHHLILDEEAVAGGDPNFKMNPPLRTRHDVSALRAGLADGTIDAVASDHAPHAPGEKALGLVEAPFGILGLETTLPLLLTHLAGEIDTVRLIESLTSAPRRILRLDPVRLEPGSSADLTVIDPRRRGSFDASRFRSRSRNTPFDGGGFTGRSIAVVAGGIWLPSL